MKSTIKLAASKMQAAGETKHYFCRVIHFACILPLADYL
jgi:hypothetical protein